jgi:hypothetical protein
MSKSKRYNKKSQSKRRRTKKNSYKNYKKGGSFGPNIPNYALNTHQTDPNYMQISARNVLQHGSGKHKMKAGSLLDFASKQFSNIISNFPSTLNNGINQTSFVQPSSNTVYTGAKVQI